MLLTLFFPDGATAQIGLPYDCTLYEPEVKQYLIQLLDEYSPEVQDQILQTFNTGPWEIVDDEGDMLMSKAAPETPPAAAAPSTSDSTNNLLQKIEQLQQLQVEAKTLSSTISEEREALEEQFRALEQKEEQLAQLQEQQKEISKELVELQKLLNELLPVSE